MIHTVHLDDEYVDVLCLKPCGKLKFTKSRDFASGL